MPSGTSTVEASRSEDSRVDQVQRNPLPSLRLEGAMDRPDLVQGVISLLKLQGCEPVRTGGASGIRFK
jgi:hypothetical protein